MDYKTGLERLRTTVNPKTNLKRFDDFSSLLNSRLMRNTTRNINNDHLLLVLPLIIEQTVYSIINGVSIISCASV